MQRFVIEPGVEVRCLDDLRAEGLGASVTVPSGMTGVVQRVAGWPHGQCDVVWENGASLTLPVDAVAPTGRRVWQEGPPPSPAAKSAPASATTTTTSSPGSNRLTPSHGAADRGVSDGAVALLGVGFIARAYWRLFGGVTRGWLVPLAAGAAVGGLLAAVIVRFVLGEDLVADPGVEADEPDGYTTLWLVLSLVSFVLAKFLLSRRAQVWMLILGTLGVMLVVSTS